MTNVRLPSGAGIAAPEKDDAHEPGSSVGTEADGTGQNQDCANLTQERKRRARLQAELALDAIAFNELKTGGLLATGAGFTAHFSDLTAAEAWVRQPDTAALRRAATRTGR